MFLGWALLMEKRLIWLVLWVIPLFITIGWVGFIVFGTLLLILLNLCVYFRSALWTSPLWAFFAPLLWGKDLGKLPCLISIFDRIHALLLYGWIFVAWQYCLGILIFAMEPSLVKPEPLSIDNNAAQNATIAWLDALHFAGPEVEAQMPIDFYGKIVDESGTPIPHAQVKYAIFDPDNPFRDIRFFQSEFLTADMDGTFHLHAKGKAFLVAPTADGYVCKGFRGDWFSADSLERYIKVGNKWSNSNLEIFSTIDYRNYHFIAPNKDHPFTFTMIRNEVDSNLAQPKIPDSPQVWHDGLFLTLNTPYYLDPQTGQIGTQQKNGCLVLTLVPRDLIYQKTYSIKCTFENGLVLDSIHRNYQEEIMTDPLIQAWIDQTIYFKTGAINGFVHLWGTATKPGGPFLAYTIATPDFNFKGDDFSGRSPRPQHDLDLIGKWRDGDKLVYLNGDGTGFVQYSDFTASTPKFETGNDCFYLATFS